MSPPFALCVPAQRLLGLLTSFRDLLPAHGTAAAAASGVAMQIFFQVHWRFPFARYNFSVSVH